MSSTASRPARSPPTSTRPPKQPARGADVIVGIGGGRALDAGKAVAVSIAHGLSDHSSAPPCPRAPAACPSSPSPSRQAAEPKSPKARSPPTTCGA
ncbi:iron-containing alcohol dehydrogenase [Streptomyces sp. NPDC059096]|uniref:iron-containing alcohol dehydrogenase n=1 Tax=Streptomyces sp. NPDC059096 TaxID=3346727 RepID=UPI0036CBFFCE